MQTYKTVNLGAYKGAPRLWLEGLFPQRVDFVTEGTKRLVKEA